MSTERLETLVLWILGFMLGFGQFLSFSGHGITFRFLVAFSCPALLFLLERTRFTLGYALQRVLHVAIL